MSKKTLLNEATVRRFMKLAEIEPLTTTFVNEMYDAPAMADDDDEPTRQKKQSLMLLMKMKALRRASKPVRKRQ